MKKMLYYSAIKKNKTILFAGKWMELEVIILSETSQTERQILHVFSHIWKLTLKKTKKQR
jgi:hypothetical protein